MSFTCISQTAQAVIFYRQHIIIHGIIIGCQPIIRAVHLVAAKEIEISNTLCNFQSFPDKKAAIMSKQVIGVFASEGINRDQPI